MGINISVAGGFNHLSDYLEGIIAKEYRPDLEMIGEYGLEYFRKNTPVDTGKTRDSWGYTIDESKENRFEITFTNSNINDGVNIAIIIDNGHATVNGKWVEGRHFINPVAEDIQRVFNETIGKELRDLR